MTTWSVEGTEAYNEAAVFAANVREDEFIDIADVSMLREVALYTAAIDQTTGNVN